MGRFSKEPQSYVVGQVELLASMCLKVNEDIKSRVTFSATTSKLTPDGLQEFILTQLDYVGLGHNTFSDDALSLIARSSDRILRKARNLSIAALLEGVRYSKKKIGIDIVNRVLIQPHWRVQNDLQAAQLF